MKQAIFILFAMMLISCWALAYTPGQYTLHVLQKDLPRGLQWFDKAAQSEQLSPAEVSELYQSALPQTQVNKHLGISTKGSVERMLILLDGARYFEKVQSAPPDFQNKKELVSRSLQVAKDEMDRFLYGEDPQALIADWRSQSLQIYGPDFKKFTMDLVEIFTELNRLLSFPIENSPTQPELIRSQGTPPDMAIAAPEEAAGPEESFESQRLKSYIDSAESGNVAGECLDAQTWQTDQADFCQNDNSLECDRSYARQCKKLH